MKNCKWKEESKNTIFPFKDYTVKFEHNGYYYTVSFGIALPHNVVSVSASDRPNSKTPEAVIDSCLSVSTWKNLLEYLLWRLRQYLVKKCHKKCC